MNVRAKFVCQTVEDHGHLQIVKFVAVYSSDKTDVNYKWSQATPQGKLEMTITNKDCFGAFKPTKKYYIDITPED